MLNASLGADSELIVSKQPGTKLSRSISAREKEIGLTALCFPESTVNAIVTRFSLQFPWLIALGITEVGSGRGRVHLLGFPELPRVPKHCFMMGVWVPTERS